MGIDWGKIGAIATIIGVVVGIIAIIVSIIISKKDKQIKKNKSVQEVGGFFYKNVNIKQKNTSKNTTKIQNVNTLVGKDLDIEQEN